MSPLTSDVASRVCNGFDMTLRVYGGFGVTSLVNYGLIWLRLCDGDISVFRDKYVVSAVFVEDLYQGVLC